jgi:hypothetical protein
MANELTKTEVSIDIVPLMESVLSRVREDMKDNPYIKEALLVLPVNGYRSAIGSFWNAVVDDLRNKIIFRSLDLFNKEMKLSREIKSYEDFQNYVNDDQLIEGAYKIGVIGWEASKILKHSKETRHFFSGHPKSSNPTPLKVFAFMEDCLKYVINEEYPAQIIDIDNYIKTMDSSDYDRNEIAIENGIGDLPEVYKKELIHRLFKIYINKASSSTLISNVELVAPILWKSLAKEIKLEVIRRVDTVYVQSDSVITDRAFQFSILVKGTAYLSQGARKYKIGPLVERLSKHLDQWAIENECVQFLMPYASVVPEELIDAYVSAITHTYVGSIGSSMRFSRTNFYADQAAIIIPDMFQLFNDRLASAFVKCLKESDILPSRINSPSKMKRLRTLGTIVREKISESFPSKKIIDLLVDEQAEKDFRKAIARH